MTKPRVITDQQLAQYRRWGEGGDAPITLNCRDVKLLVDEIQRLRIELACTTEPAVTNQMPQALEFFRAFISGGVNQDFKPWARELYDKLYRSTAEPIERADNDDLVENRWYWVSKDGQDWWPAKHATHAVGGWSNEDTWEDFDREVRFWKRINPPAVEPNAESSPSVPPRFTGDARFLCRDCGRAINEHLQPELRCPTVRTNDGI